MKKLNKNLKKISNYCILIIFTLIVLYFSLKDDFNNIVNQIASINKLWLLLAFTLMGGYWLFKSFVLHMLARRYNSEYTLKKAFKLQIIVNFFNAITPFATGGQPYEVYSINKEKIKMTDATNIVIQNFIVYQIALVLLGTIAVVYNYFFHLFPSNSILKNLITLGFIINFFVIVGLFIISYAKKINKFLLKIIITLLSKLKVVKNKEEVIKKYNDYLKEFHVGASKLLENKKEFFLMILYHLISLCALYLIPLVLLFGMGNYTSINGAESILTSAYVMIIGSFVPIPGGTGGLEYGFVKFYGNFIKGSSLNAIMLLWRFITYYFGMILGAIFLNIKRKDR